MGKLIQQGCAAVAAPGRPVALAMLVVIGLAGSGLLLLAGAPSGAVLVPFSLAVLLAVALAPFPMADRLFGFALIGTMPLLPPSPLPNLPLAAGVLVVAIVRVAQSHGQLLSVKALLLLGLAWGSLLLGVVVSHWPPLEVMLRPAAILGFGLLASILGLLVWTDESRRWRWIEGITLGLIIVAGSALIVFLLQYVMPIGTVAESVTASLGYLRGEAGEAKFQARNNWILPGEWQTLRAVSPLVPSPNNLGGYLGIAGPLAAALAVRATRRMPQLLAELGVLLGVAAVAVTYSRSSWLALSVAGVFVVLAAAASLRGVSRAVAQPVLPRLARIGLIALIGGAIGLAAALTTSSEAALDRITDAGTDSSVAIRVEGDLDALRRVQTNLVRGTGLGNWTGLSEDQAEGRDPLRVPYVHNVYLQYATATGIFGAVWALLVVGFLIVGAVGAIWRGGRAQLSSWLLGLAVLAIGLYAAVQFFFDDNLLNPQYAWLLLWAWGGAIAYVAGNHSAAPRPT